MFTSSVWRKICLRCHEEHNKKRCWKNIFHRNFWPKFHNYLKFEKMLNHMCWPWGVVYCLRYNYENFPHSLNDTKHVCIVMETRKKFDEKKKFFIEISDSKFKIFMGIWRSPNPSSCLLLACNWLKYDYGSFLQSLGVAKHVRIGLKNIKTFCWNKSFHRNFCLKFDISHGAITRKVPYVTTLSAEKTFLRP